MKRALVTGGASPIGEAICRALAAAGHHLIVHAHQSAGRAAALVAELHQQGGSAETMICDLADGAAVGAALAPVLAKGVPQVIVHNAGTHDDATMAGMSEAQWRGVISVSLDGFFNIVQPLLLPMTRTRWGRIIVISSLTARIGNRGQVNYAAAKAGLEGAARTLAREVGSRGITVNAVAPGIIDTPAALSAFDAEAITSLVPAKRAGRPEEVADLVAFLASDRSGYISGQTIGINGGMA